MTTSVWSDFVNICDEVFDWYMKLLWYMQCYMAFFIIQMVWVYARSYRDIGINFGVWNEMTIFDWYTLFILFSGICIATFFIQCVISSLSIWCLSFDSSFHLPCYHGVKHPSPYNNAYTEDVGICPSSS